MNFILSASEIVSLVSSGISVLSVIYLGLIKFAQMDVKVDTLWQFQLRRGEVEAVLRGYATKNSPLKLNEERALEAFPAELGRAIQQYFSRLGRNLTRTEMAAEIERRFGERIVDEVCVPNGFSEGACLILAMHFATGGAGRERHDSPVIAAPGLVPDRGGPRERRASSPFPGATRNGGHRDATHRG
jgi:hypothetical protein